MYFFDTGLLCFLLGISSAEQLEDHYFFGNIFEDFIVSELYKKRTNKAERPVFWFWQDQHGNEIDLLIEENLTMKAIGIKSGQTYNTRFSKGLKLWQNMSGADPVNQFLVYGGIQDHAIENGTLLPWQEALRRL